MSRLASCSLRADLSRLASQALRSQPSRHLRSRALPVRRTAAGGRRKVEGLRVDGVVCRVLMCLFRHNLQATTAQWRRQVRSSGCIRASKERSNAARRRKVMAAAVCSEDSASSALLRKLLRRLQLAPRHHAQKQLTNKDFSARTPTRRIDSKAMCRVLLMQAVAVLNAACLCASISAAIASPCFCCRRCRHVRSQAERQHRTTLVERDVHS